MRKLHGHTVIVRIDQAAGAVLQQLTAAGHRRRAGRDRLRRHGGGASQRLRGWRLLLLLFLTFDHAIHVADDLLQGALQALLLDFRRSGFDFGLDDGGSHGLNASTNGTNEAC